MSVLIKGMEMPNICAYCFIDTSECNLHESVNIWKERHPDCPLIELLPHGDLVDLNDMVHPNDSMRRMTIDEQLRRTCEGWSADRKRYVVIEGSET